MEKANYYFRGEKIANFPHYDEGDDLDSDLHACAMLEDCSLKESRVAICSIFVELEDGAKGLAHPCEITKLKTV